MLSFSFDLRMDNGHDEERLAERFSGGVGLRESSDENEVKNDSLFQVIKAVEAAEATIKQQVFVASLYFI